MPVNSNAHGSLLAREHGAILSGMLCNARDRVSSWQHTARGARQPVPFAMQMDTESESDLAIGPGLFELRV